jgi:hypothetical protein
MIGPQKQPKSVRAVEAEWRQTRSERLDRIAKEIQDEFELAQQREDTRLHNERSWRYP